GAAERLCRSQRDIRIAQVTCIEIRHGGSETEAAQNQLLRKLDALRARGGCVGDLPNGCSGRVDYRARYLEVGVVAAEYVQVQAQVILEKIALEYDFVGIDVLGQDWRRRDSVQDESDIRRYAGQK